MVFNSIAFLIFFLVFFFIYWAIGRKNLRAQNLLILLASYFFYGWWDWRFVFLLVLSTFIDYGFGLAIAEPSRNRRLYLWLSIVNNLAILGFFKYYNFFADSFQQLSLNFGLQVHPYMLEIVLPVGISFYTFHGMSYVFDIYNGKVKPTRNFVDYAVFVSFFPLLVAGPIERANHLLPQVQRRRVFDYDQAMDGMRLILWGLFKKIIVADSLAVIVNDIFQNPEQQHGSTLVLGAVYFAFQIYGDFSGYTDIALGTAKLLGFELLTNFKFPYFSRDIAEFWRRWHISLSSWFRDYVYIPLGGSKGGLWPSIRNIFIIFLLSGFWHGAKWTYIIWGAYHALLYVPLFVFKTNRRYTDTIVAENSMLPTVGECFSMFLTFTLVTVGWVFFRADSLSAALTYFSQLPHGITHVPDYLEGLRIVLIFLVMDWTARRHERRPHGFVPDVIYLCVMVLALLVFGKGSTENVEFIYFQF